MIFDGKIVPGGTWVTLKGYESLDAMKEFIAAEKEAVYELETDYTK